MKNYSLLIISSVTFILSACQTVPYEGQARNVVLKPQKEGVISIPTNPRDEDRAKADAIMKRNCGSLNAVVYEEGEVAVGTKVEGNEKSTDRASTKAKIGSLWGIPLVTGEAGGKDVNTSSTTTQIKEWHISYRCDSGGAKKMR